jgi:parvulin-like peptidyl-prolyl isomerase
MGKESRIRQERKTGIVEKPRVGRRDRFPIVMRIVSIVLIIVLATWGSLFAIKRATGTMAYLVGTEKVLQADIDAGIQNYIDMYTQYGVDLTTAEYASTLESIRTTVQNSSIEQALFVQYAKSKNMTPDPAKLKESLDTEVESAVTQNETSFGADAKAFEDAVIARYGSMDKFRTYLAGQIQPYVERQLLADMVTQEINASVAVTDTDVRTYFDAQGRVNAEHFLVRVDKAVDSAATIAAKKRVAEEVYADIKKQEVDNKSFDFATYAKAKAAELSKDTPDYARYEALDWFNKGQMVKGFETAVFAAAKGDIIGPVETEFGFHIIHKIDQAANADTFDTPQKVKAAHIVVSWADAADQTVGEQQAKATADKAYAELQKGLKFASAVTKYSNGSDAATGGILDYFAETDNQAVYAAAVALKTGKYSAPFTNGSSYEIVQLLGIQAPVKASLSDKATFDKVKTALEDERKAAARDAFVVTLKDKYPVREGRWSRITRWYDGGPGKVLSAVGRWFAVATGKVETTAPIETPTETPSTPSAE